MSDAGSAVRRPGPLLQAGFAIVMLLALLAAFEDTLVGGLLSVLDWIGSHGSSGRFLYLLTFCAAIIAFVPATPLYLAGGILFGWWQGCLLSLLAMTLGGAVSFQLARHGLRERLQRQVGGHPLYRGLKVAARRQGLKTAFLIRVSPSLPAWLIHYGLGLTPMRFGHYLASSLATLPMIMAFTYYGKVLGDLAALRGRPEQAHEEWYYLILVCGALVTALVSYLLARRINRLLDTEPAEGEA